MKKLSSSNLNLLLGGWANPEGCAKVQQKAFEMSQDPNTTDEQWDEWADDFDKECLGI